MNRLILSLACLSLAGLSTAGCTFKSSSTIDDDNFAGSGGEGGGEGGSGSDAGTGGTGGNTGGTGGADTYEPNMMCVADAPNRPGGDCEWLDQAVGCEACLQTECCEEVSACSTQPGDPEHQCFFGGPDLDFDGETDGNGEWYYVQGCLMDAMTDPDNSEVDAGVLLEECLELGGTPECGGSASVATENLAVCAQVFCEDACLIQ